MKRAQLLKIKAQVSSIWAKECMLMIVCVLYHLTWLPLIGSHVKWREKVMVYYYIIIIILTYIYIYISILNFFYDSIALYNARSHTETDPTSLEGIINPTFPTLIRLFQTFQCKHLKHFGQKIFHQYHCAHRL